MHPTVAQVLDLPQLKRGQPQLLAGEEALGTPVRWVHVSELPDIGPLLRGGELVLTTGMGLCGGIDLARYVDELCRANASGVVVELGRAFNELPTALVERARQRGLPLVALHRETRFVEVTEVVHGLILDAQVDALRSSEAIHTRFTQLSVEGASYAEIVREAAALGDMPVILENLTHQVLAHDAAGRPLAAVLEDWDARSRAHPTESRTEVVSDGEPWLITSVGARGERWGRLVAIPDDPPSPQQRVVVERAATAVALNRLVERDRETLERQSHRSLLGDIRGGAYSSSAEIHLRADALGVRLADQDLIAVVVRARRPEAGSTVEREARRRDDAEVVARALRGAGVPALVGGVGDGDVGALVPLPEETTHEAARERVLREVGAAVHRGFSRSAPTPGVTVGAGSTVPGVRQARRSFLEAEQVVDAAEPLGDGKLVFELADVRVRGLLHIMRDDPRLQAFVERELGPLLAHEDRHGEDLLAVLDAYLAHGRNKSAAADALGISRPAFYQRLARVGRVLETDLGDVEPCLSLHVALLGLRAMRSAAALGDHRLGGPQPDPADDGAGPGRTLPQGDRHPPRGRGRDRSAARPERAGGS